MSRNLRSRRITGDGSSPSTEREGLRRSRPTCAWCRRFVAKTVPLTSWRVRVPHPNQQRRDDQWNYWARLLCPGCQTGVETLWRKNATLGQVIDKRPEGLPPDHPQWLPPHEDSPLLHIAPELMLGTDHHESVRL